MRLENWSEKIVLTLGVVKCALVAAFFYSFGLVETNEAQAENVTACQGVNLVEMLKSEKPEVFAKILKEAAAVPNGNSIFWKIARDGYPTSHLFGTMHMADPKIATLRDDVKSTINNSDTLVIESLDALNPEAAQKEMSKLAHLTLLQEGTLRDLVRDDLEDKLANAVSERGVPMFLADRMQPWLIATMVSLPICEMERKKAGEKVLDAALAEYAEAQGKEIAGLETVNEQLTAMASLPQAYHVSALEETLAGGSLGIDMIETLKVIYLDGKMGMVFPLMKEMAPESYSGEGASQFQEALIVKRNGTMVERVLPILKSGKSFVAVGALHLPGETGIVNLLQQEGFTVTPMEIISPNG